MSDNESPAASSHQRVLEDAVPLSQSVIWKLQSEYYADRGLKAWTEDLVPSYITNNPFIARIYAQIVAAFVFDCLARPHSPPISPENPLRILELGGGTGKFSYLFLRRLMPLLRANGVPAQSVRYCLSDCSEELLSYWRQNEYLKEFSGPGILEFELLRAGDKTTAATKASTSPLVVIANYVFDSLPQDAFIIRNGEISEALITTSAGGNSQSPAALADVQVAFSNAPTLQRRYAYPAWNAALEHYRSALSAATLFFPSAALSLLQQLSQTTGGDMLVLAADKGFAHEEELGLIQGPPQLEFHGSRRCFSAMVNFDAISRYFAATGGFALLPPKHFTNLNICAFVSRNAQSEYPRTASAYQGAVEAFGPDDLFAVMSWLNPHLDGIALAQALSLLRLTHWDATAFLRIFPAIAQRLRNVVGERNDLHDAVLRVWENRYPVEPADNLLAFDCGAVLLELHFYSEAAGMFRASEQLLGRTAATSYNLGLCALGLDDRAAALQHMREACGLDPTFGAARASRERLENEMKSS